MADLKPCPFCGGEASAEFPAMIDDKPTDWFAIGCKNEKCRIQPMTDWHKNKAVVVREWNRRAYKEGDGLEQHRSGCGGSYGIEPDGQADNGR